VIFGHAELASGLALGMAEIRDALIRHHACRQLCYALA
jgi:hypothetical protein